MVNKAALSCHVPPEVWQGAWRLGFAPQLSDAALTALRDALVRDDAELMQGGTTDPIDLSENRAQRVERACAIGYCGWKTEGFATVGEVTEWFYMRCHFADQLLAQTPYWARHFLLWFDAAPREIARAELLAEVERTIAERAATAQEVAPC